MPSQDSSSAKEASAPETTSYQTDHQNLRGEVNQIIAMIKKDATPEAIRDKHSSFVQNYPKFFEKLMDKNVDMEQMHYIIGMYEKVQRNKTTFDAASKKIGQRMFDQYVKPDLPPPSDTPSPGIQFGSNDQNGKNGKDKK